MPGQTKGRRKAFLEWTDIDLSSKLSLACRGNVNYYKSVLHPILTLREHPGNYFQNKLVSCLKLWVSRYILFLSKLKRRVRPFLEGARRGVALWDYPQEHLVVKIDEKVCPSVKFEIILPLLCCLLKPLISKDVI